MTKILVREHNAAEELDQLVKFLNTEAQKIVVLDEENPAPSTLAEDDSPEITWYIHKGGDIPSDLFSVVITDDGNGADGANVVVMKDDFSPSTLLDQMRKRLDQPKEHPLKQLTDGYITGDLTTLVWHEGVSPESETDAAGVLDTWRSRLGGEPKADGASDGGAEDDDSSQGAESAIPTIHARIGW
jgi:hypothetical protein